VTGANVLAQLPGASFGSLVHGFATCGASGSISLGDLLAQNANVLLVLGKAGQASGSINTQGLGVVGSAGSATLVGTIDGVVGRPAAQFGFKDGLLLNQNYLFNNCPIETVCVAVPTTLIAGATPSLQSPQIFLPASDLVTNAGARQGAVYFSTTRPRRPYTDPSIDSLNIGAEDLF
jgi:hypothetical protein